MSKPNSQRWTSADEVDTSRHYWALMKSTSWMMFKNYKTFPVRRVESTRGRQPSILWSMESLHSPSNSTLTFPCLAAATPTHRKSPHLKCVTRSIHLSQYLIKWTEKSFSARQRMYKDNPCRLFDWFCDKESISVCATIFVWSPRRKNSRHVCLLKVPNQWFPLCNIHSVSTILLCRTVIRGTSDCTCVSGGRCVPHQLQRCHSRHESTCPFH